ncbi:MAG: hypothetical protein HY795_02515 [Desulfovibrio sp.]|nr:hypothetical protein [Desulfovibrio sp.]
MDNTTTKIVTDAEKEAMRGECMMLSQWAFVKIRFICGYGTGLTAGEEAWIWTLAEFAHNLPHLIKYDFSRPLFFVQMDQMKCLQKLYMRHHKEIVGRRAEGWTKERIYTSLFPQSIASNAPSEAGQSTGKDNA